MKCNASEKQEMKTKTNLIDRIYQQVHWVIFAAFLLHNPIELEAKNSIETDSIAFPLFIARWSAEWSQWIGKTEANGILYVLYVEHESVDWIDPIDNPFKWKEN